MKRHRPKGAGPSETPPRPQPLGTSGPGTLEPKQYAQGPARGGPAQSEDDFRVLFENSDAAMLFWDGDLFVDCNQAALRMTGHTSREGLVGRHPGEVSPEFQPDGRSSREKAQEMYDRAVEKGSHTFEWVHTRANGEEFWVEVVLTTLPLGGRLLFHVVWFDITERKLAEAERTETGVLLDSVVENIPDMIAVKSSRDLRFVRINRAGEEMLGRARETLIGKANRDVFTPEQAALYDASDREVLTSGETLDIPEEVLEAPGGGPRVLQTKKIPIRGLGGEAEYILRISKDITAWKRVEDQLRRQAAAIDQAAEVFIITDTEATIQYVNPAFERVTGYTAAEAVGRNPRFLKGRSGDEGFYQALWRTLLDGQTWHGRFVNRRKDGSFYDEDATIFPLRDESGITLNYVAVKRDVTEHVQMEKHLRQSQKMEALGTLAGGIAHDFNNILTPIIGFAQVLLDGIDGPLNPEQRKDLERIVVAGTRAQDMVGQILTFARQTERERQPVRIGPVVKEALKFVRSSLPTTIEIRQSLETEQDVVVADPTQVHQVLMNLFTNASHAMGESGGVLEVALKDAEVDAGLGDMPPELKPGQYLLLTVSDTGAGMEPEVLERIFEPFFSTKAPGKGTGLGLSVVHGIAESHGGAIKVYSDPGQGTTVNVFLPTTRRTETDATAKPLAVPTGNERVLFVDDEEAIAVLGRKTLQGLGYRVTATTDPVAALELFRDDPSGFDLVLTDQTMPHLTGAALAEKIAETSPDTPVILCTGFAGAGGLARGLPANVQEVVRKPITIAELGRVVRRALDHPLE